MCTFNELVIGGSVCKHRDIHRVIRVSLDGFIKNRINCISILRKQRRGSLDTRRGADVGSDSYFVQETLQIKLKSFKGAEAADRLQPDFNTQKLKDQTTKNMFTAITRKKAGTKINTSEETSVEKHWNNLKAMWSRTYMDFLGRKKRIGQRMDLY